MLKTVITDNGHVNYNKYAQACIINEAFLAMLRKNKTGCLCWFIAPVDKILKYIIK